MNEAPQSVNLKGFAPQREAKAVSALTRTRPTRVKVPRLEKIRSGRGDSSLLPPIRRLARRRMTFRSLGSAPANLRHVVRL
jgi:hypothetical protein